MFACSGSSRVPAPRPIVSIVMAGSGPNRSTTVVRIAAPVGVVSSISTVDSASGTPLQELGRRRGGQRHPAVRRLDPAPARRHRAGLEPVDAEQVEPDGRADDVDDRVDRADLVEVDLRQVDPVDRRLGLAELAEDPLGQLVLPGGQAALVDDRLDVVQVAMRVLVRA